VSIARRPEARTNAKTDPRSVLVVEDEPLVVKLLKHVLEGEGFDVRTAMNRDEIAEELRRPPLVDLVLLDVILPDIDGFQILDRIRLHPEMKSTPVVMLTSKATREAVLRGLESGANGYITKPFEIPVLIKALHAVLGMSEDGDVIASKDPWS
jgi:DNA-binding response OmpR family regulator